MEAYEPVEIVLSYNPKSQINRQSEQNNYKNNYRQKNTAIDMKIGRDYLI